MSTAAAELCRLRADVLASDLTETQRRFRAHLLVHGLAHAQFRTIVCSHLIDLFCAGRSRADTALLRRMVREAAREIS